MAVKSKKLEKNNSEGKENRNLTPAEMSTSSSVNAAAVMEQYGKIYAEQNLQELVNSLRKSMGELKNNNLAHCENMLFAQAHALQSIFTNFSRRAISQEYMKHLDTYLRIALKAQNQCRMTLETLATIKNPPVVYAKQANIAHGHQQVNNGTATASHAEKNQTSPNELLEADTNEKQWLDTGTASKAGRADQAMATVDKSHRRKNG
ncbi:MAG: hypothetical protein U1F12_10395 [Pseudomonadales bacterium]|jgi:hypothetical protein